MESRAAAAGLIGTTGTPDTLGGLPLRTFLILVERAIRESSTPDDNGRDDIADALDTLWRDGVTATDASTPEERNAELQQLAAMWR